MRSIAPMSSPMDADASHVDPLTDRLTTVMVALMKGSHSETMDVAMEFELTLSQLRTLFLLDHSDTPLAVNAIAERISLSMPATGRAIDALHKNGLVSRREDPVDRRVKRIELTERGANAIHRISAARIAAVQRLVDALSPDEREQLEIATATLDAVVASHLPSHPSSCGTRPAAVAGAPETPSLDQEQPA